MDEADPALITFQALGNAGANNGNSSSRSGASNGAAKLQAALWSFSSLVLKAEGGDEGLALVPATSVNATTNPDAAAPWLCSGDWLWPQALLQLAQQASAAESASAGGTMSASTLSSPSPVLRLSNITMFVTPQSLALVQQALCLAAAVSTVPGGPLVTHVRDGMGWHVRWHMRASLQQL
jgi:hypothetical protein